MGTEEVLTENEKKGELIRVKMPGYGIFFGILMLIFAFLGVSAVYHIVKMIMPVPSVCMVVAALLLYELWRIGRGIWIGRESWSGIISIPGAVLVLYSFGCFVCERREKDAN